ncbi:hypothetical protein AYR62_13850 [Secundilactobacillus paracollinoides]|uniref:DUF3021 domain-containing protein n=1 Tax=Secundilactobacillus paracollinoides TaxID=240427 RepID=A0A1B2IWR1_9LACO|nr:DUF3021 domain-containing protein [Secundilactobacillus paracollinoides]ANZ60681.1 hypothetical protein AYR61_04545 [Secundilactobacillus paracollinoides]ANZ65053.1 hypothetical protein AYR62_13850 [Secundilactobacillus paracollinoides]ANZ66524.1 hypothetical protein AYR63_04830 [Secundilactobacillus paracollinoides]
MKRTILSRVIIGVVVGVFIGFMIAMGISLAYRAPIFMPSSTSFVNHFSSSLMATAASIGLWALMGIVFAVGALVFEVERWSITRQTVTNFIITYVLFTPLAVLAGWFPISPLWSWLLSFTIEFIVIYVIMWVTSMRVARASVRRLNALLNQTKK